MNSHGKYENACVKCRTIWCRFLEYDYKQQIQAENDLTFDVLRHPKLST